MKKTKLNLQEMRLADLHPAEYNPRVELKPDDPEYQKIRRSIEEFGYADPIIANQDGTIIGGHQRYNVLRDLGYETVQVVVVDLDKPREKALNLALNKITGSWDEEKVYDLLMELDLSDIDMQLSGFERDEFETLAVKFQEEATEDGFDEEAALDAIRGGAHKAAKGTVWALGRHRLMCGDSTSQADLDVLMAGDTADLVLTDPPYNVDYEEKTAFLEKARGRKEPQRSHDKISNDRLSKDGFYQFLRAVFANVSRGMRAGAVIYVFHADSQGHVFRDAFLDAGLKLSQCLVWEKNALVLSRNDYHWRHEPILYGWKEGAPHYFVHDRSQDTVLLEDDLDLQSMKKADLIAFIEQMRREASAYTSVLYEKKPVRSDMHPTMKPVALVGRLMANSSRRDDIVLDPFGGSGSTLIAAEQLGRSAYLMELDPVYCDVIIRRWEAYTDQKAVKLDG